MAAKRTETNRVEIKTHLYGIQPQIWRRFSIDMSATFAALHDAIQAAMLWENKSPHEFRHGKGKRLVDVIGPVGLEDQTIGEFQDELKVTIADFIGRRQLPIRILYRYDFADEWIHEIAFEKRVAGPPDALPELLGGERACPPEDFGGSFAYMQALHGDIEWMHPGYEPEKFDAAEVSFDPKRKIKPHPRRRRRYS